MNKITQDSIRSQAASIYDFANGDWTWKDQENYYHLIRNGIDLLADKKAKGCSSSLNGDWTWQDQEGGWHDETPTQNHCDGDNGDRDWQDQEGDWHTKYSG